MTNPTRPAGLSPASTTDTGALGPGALVAERYRIERTLGEGGMGVVYLAEHVAMRKTVALKVLHAEGSGNAEIVQRFEREAVAAASIDHQNVASATDFGALPDGSFYLVLEFVSGRSLRDVLAGGALEPARALAVLRGIVAGVAAAHARGIVHRDLKPENVMLTEREGNPDFVKVLDFGIAKVGMDAEPTGPTSRPLTRVGTIMGTPNYMSPEQAVGQPCDARADVYALGVVFYEMLVGEPLFDGDPVMVLASHVTSPPPPLPASVQDALGSQSDAILQKMLAKSADARFQTAVELQTALQELSSRLSPTPASVVGLSPAPSAVASAAAESPQHAVTAPTQLADSGDPAAVVAQIAVLRTTASAQLDAPPVDKTRRMVLGAALAAAAAGLLVLLVLALRGPSSSVDAPGPAGSTATSSSAGGGDPDDELPPLSSGREITKAAPPAAAEDSKPEGDAGAKAGAGGGQSGNGKKGGKKGALDGVLKPFKKLF